MPVLQADKVQQICRWHCFDTANKVERVAVAQILSASQLSINTRGAFHIVLAGGTTPKKIYEALRHCKSEWGSWHVYFGDERCLPSEHNDRNSRMAAQAWLDHVAIPASQIHPIPTEQGADFAAKKYAGVLDQIKIFDLVLLGLGEDGHTASLFPEHDAGEAPDAPSTLIILDAPKPPPQRISLSARRLSETKQLMFLVTGSGKKQAVEDWRSGISIPAATITPACGVDIYTDVVLSPST